MVRSLVELGNNMISHSLRRKYYGYALRGAVSEFRDDETIIQFLIENNADISYQHSGDSVLMIAATDGHQKIVEILVQKGADINAKGGESDCAFLAALHCRHLSIVRFLVENGADVNIQCPNMYAKICTSLQIATTRGDKDIMALIL